MGTTSIAVSIRPLVALIMVLAHISDAQGSRDLLQSSPALYFENRLSPGWALYGISANGTIYVWGNDPKDTDKYFVAPKDYARGTWSQAGSGWHYVCAIPIGGGKPKCWQTDSTSDVVKAVDKVTANLTQLSVGFDHCCGISAEGVLQCWGSSLYGALGNGKNENKPGFFQLPGSDWTYVSADDGVTCAIKKDSSLWCWGDNEYNSVNSSKGKVVLKPSQVPGKWKSVSVGGGYVLAIDTSGKAFGWGLYESIGTDAASGGSIGSGKPLCYNLKTQKFCKAANDDYKKTEKKPVPVAGGRKWASVSAGGGLSCGVEASTAKGYCWGYGTGEALSLGSPQTNTPKLIDSSKWAYIKVGGSVRCGIKIDGSLWCWGRGLFDCSFALDDICPLGDGTIKNSAKPVKVINVDSWLPK